MNNWIPLVFGCLLVLLGVFETFMAVLHPRAVTGPVTALLNRIDHYLLKTRLGHIDHLLLASGPLLILSQIMLWATLLLLGFSLLVWPQLGSGISATGSSVTDTSFATAIYFAGFTITTLGIGDLVPRTIGMKLLTVLISGMGFSFFTLVLAYVISIYSALARRNQFACEIDYRTGRTGDTARYLESYLQTDNPSLINQDLYTLSSNLAELLESHHFYPLLHYFRFSEPHYAMHRMLRFCLEVATALRALSMSESTTASPVSEPADRLWNASLQMLVETCEHFVVCTSEVSTSSIEVPESLNDLMKRLGVQDASLSKESFTREYVELAKQWNENLQSLETCTGRL